MRIFNRVQFVIRNLSSVTTATAAPLPFWKVPLGSWLSSSSGLLKGLAQVRGVHDQRKKGDEELLGFVEEEIVTKLKVQRSTPIPSTLQGFMLDVDKSEITLTNKVGNEEIIISANVNHSVDGGGGDGDPSMSQKEPPGGIRAKPNFDVEVKKGNQTLVFSCSFLPNEMEGGQEDFEDVFVIGEVSLFDGEAKKTDYAIAGDILDEYLYDLFMNFLEDRGISNEFISKFSELCTNYEHYLYIELMVNLQKFLKEEV